MTTHKARSRAFRGDRAERTPAQAALSKAIRENNHGEASFVTAWRMFAGNVPFPFERGVEVRPNRKMTFDFADKALKVAIEIDGDVHAIIQRDTEIWMNWKKMEQDREKWNLANEDEWTLLNYTVRQVVDEPDRVIRQVLEVLERRRGMKLKRIEPGYYQSADGRVEIRRIVSQQTNRTDETCWTVAIDGVELARAENTMRDAVELAERRLQKQEGET